MESFILKERYTNLEENDVLIKMKYAPINPSDFYTIKGMYWDRKPYPSVVGLEGMGEIIDANNSNSKFIGKQVLVHFFNNPSEGAFSNYCKSNINNILVIDNEEVLNLQFLINPLTAIGLKSILKAQNVNSFLQLGASTSVGKLVLKLTTTDNYRSISILRNNNQLEFIKSFSNTSIICLDTPNYFKEIKHQIALKSPQVSFDCFSGEKTGTIFNYMPENSKTYIYGALEHKQISNIDPQCLIFQNKQIHGFHCFHNFIKNNPVSKYSEDLSSIINSEINCKEPKIFKFDEFESAINYYRNKNEKIILNFN